MSHALAPLSSFVTNAEAAFSRKYFETPNNKITPWHLNYCTVLPIIRNKLYKAKSFLKHWQSLRWSRNLRPLMEHASSLPYSKKPSLAPMPGPWIQLTAFIQRNTPWHARSVVLIRVLQWDSNLLGCDAVSLSISRRRRIVVSNSPSGQTIHVQKFKNTEPSLTAWLCKKKAWAFETSSSMYLVTNSHIPQDLNPIFLTC